MSITLHLKANSRGSWTNVCSFNAVDLPNIKDGARQLARHSGASVSFKITDDHNVTLHSLDARQAPLTWQDRLN